jgi:hypothetical protein
MKIIKQVGDNEIVRYTSPAPVPSLWQTLSKAIGGSIVRTAPKVLDGGIKVIGGVAKVAGKGITIAVKSGHQIMIKPPAPIRYQPQRPMGKTNAKTHRCPHCGK